MIRRASKSASEKMLAGFIAKAPTEPPSDDNQTEE
jgi:hypothetical protein